jgi:hypothetical protein
VLQELEGLARGNKVVSSDVPSSNASLSHAQHVKESAGSALAFLRSRPTNVRCVTTRGTMLPSFTFTQEEDSGELVSICRFVSDPTRHDELFDTGH